MRVILFLCVFAAACRGKSSAPSCKEVADHVQTLLASPEEHDLAALHELFQTRCTEDTWSADVRSCVSTTKAVDEPRNCKQKMTADQVAHLDHDLAVIADREQARTIPTSCGHYEKVLSEVAKCDKLPADIREGLKHKYEAFKGTWATVDDKRTLSPTCEAAISAVKVAASECPGALTW